MTNMNLLFVTQFFPHPGATEQTGGTISNLNMLRALASETKVCVLSFARNSSAEDFSDEPFNVVSRAAPQWRGVQLIRNWQGFVKTEVARVVSSMSLPDVLIATTSTLSSFDIKHPGTARVALVQAFENFGFQCPWVPFRQRIQLAKQAVVRRLGDPRLIRKADAVWAYSEFMKSAIVSRFGVDSFRIHILTQSLDIKRSRCSAPQDTVGFVNRGHDKGISFVLDVASRSPELTYLVYGHDKDLPPELPANMRWMGWASDRSAMFESAALWLVPSLWAEPFGRVSVEAQAAGRAVLVASLGGLPETVVDERFIMENFDVDAWLERMRALLGLPDTELRTNGSKVRALFSDTVHDDRLFSALRATALNDREIGHD